MPIFMILLGLASLLIALWGAWRFWLRLGYFLGPQNASREALWQAQLLEAESKRKER